MAAARVLLRQVRRRRLVRLLRRTRRLRPVRLPRLAYLSNAGRPLFSSEVIRQFFQAGFSVSIYADFSVIL
jgi:hypothetical protein